MWFGPNAGPVFFSFGVVALIACWMYWRDIQPVIARVFGPILDRYFVTSSTGPAAPPSSTNGDQQFDADVAGKGNGETAGNSSTMRETAKNDPFSFPDAFLTAALLIEHNGLSETDVLRVAFGAKAGKKTNAAGELTRYGAAHAQLALALATVRQPAGAPQYRTLDEQHRTALPVQTATKA